MHLELNLARDLKGNKKVSRGTSSAKEELGEMWAHY